MVRHSQVLLLSVTVKCVWPIFLKLAVKVLNLLAPIPDKKEINLNFYFNTSLWWRKKFYEGLEGLHETF